MMEEVAPDVFVHWTEPTAEERIDFLEALLDEAREAMLESGHAGHPVVAAINAALRKEAR